MIFSPSRRAACAIRAASRRFSSKIDCASRLASRVISAASASAVVMYLRPRDSAPERIVRALFSADSTASLALLAASLMSRSAEFIALDSRACADLIIDIAVSVAKISNSSRLSEVTSRRERRSANCDSSSRMRSTELGAALSASLKPTQLLNEFFSLMVID